VEVSRVAEALGCLKGRPPILGFGFVLPARGCDLRAGFALRRQGGSGARGPRYLLALTRPRRVRFFALFLAVLRAERLRSVLRGFLVFKYMGARDLG
jgi:hypothetical protein